MSHVSGNRGFHLQKVSTQDSAVHNCRPCPKTFAVMSILYMLTHSHTMTPFDRSGKEAFWKHCGKRRNCLYKQSLLFPQCFLLYQRQKLSFSFELSSANAFNLVRSKILSCGNGLKDQYIYDPDGSLIKMNFMDPCLYMLHNSFPNDKS